VAATKPKFGWTEREHLGKTQAGGQVSKLVPSDVSLRRIPANGVFGKYLSCVDLC
jgi:hypothetical protein